MRWSLADLWAAPDYVYPELVSWLNDTKPPVDDITTEM